MEVRTPVATRTSGDPGLGDRALVGIDIGTSSAKATVLRAGRVTELASRPYPTRHPAPGHAEQEPDDWWRAVGDLLSTVAAEIGPRVGVAVGLTGQMHTSVLRDEAGTRLRPAILWSDERAGHEAAALERAVPDWEDVTGNSPIPAFTASHLAWVARNEPEIASRIASVTLVKDEIRERLGAERTTEPSDASGTCLLDTRTDEWSSRLLDAARVSRGWLPGVVPSAALVGEIRRHPAGDERLFGSPLVAGAGDQAAQAVALGVVADGDVGVSVGSSGVAFSVLSTPRPGSVRHALPASWLALDSVHAAGTALSWWSGVAGVPLEDMGQSGARRGAPTFLPHLQGHRDGTGAPGTLSHLRIDHGRDDISYAVVEGVAIALARLVRSVTTRELPAEIKLGGGAGRMPLLRTILATLLDRPVVHSSRGPAFGAAVLAAQGVGWSELVPAPGADSERSDPDPDWAPQLLERAARHDALESQIHPA